MLDTEILLSIIDSVYKQINIKKIDNKSVLDIIKGVVNIINNKNILDYDKRDYLLRVLELLIDNEIYRNKESKKIISKEVAEKLLLLIKTDIITEIITNIYKFNNKNNCCLIKNVI